MIEVIKKVGEGKNEKLSEGSLEDLKSKQLVWVNAVNPDKKELQEISEKTKIPVRDLKEYLDPRERPKTFELEEYSLIVFASPVKERFIRTIPVAIFISETKDIITLSHTNVEAINRIQNLAEGNKIKIFADPSMFLFRLMDEIINDYFLLFDDLEEQIENIETQVFTRPTSHAPSKIFRIKKSLIYFHKSLTANREVITGIEKEYVSKLSKKDIKKFRELYNDVIQLIDTEETYRDIVSGTLDIYLSSVSNNLNVVMKRLTVYATLVMVPTLISGIYGMNFRNMPELDWKLGYPLALGMMLFSVILIYYYFQRKDWV